MEYKGSTHVYDYFKVLDSKYLGSVGVFTLKILLADTIKKNILERKVIVLIKPDNKNSIGIEMNRFLTLDKRGNFDSSKALYRDSWDKIQKEIKELKNFIESKIKSDVNIYSRNCHGIENLDSETWKESQKDIRIEIINIDKEVLLNSSLNNI